MALNVNWRWNMPTVGSPNAESDDMAQGLQQLGQGIGQMIAGKRKWDRDQEIRDLAQENWERNFAQQKAQNELAQLNANRNYALQRDLFNLNRDKQFNDIDRQKKQDEYIYKVYDQYFRDKDSEELEQLLAKYKDGATGVLVGLNPQFLNLR